MEKFRTDRNTEIEKCEVVRETKHRIVYKKKYSGWGSGEQKIREDTENLSSAYHSWHNTFEDAKAHLLTVHRSAIINYLEYIEREKKKIEEVELIKLEDLK